jgi:hypothetical protein
MGVNIRLEKHKDNDDWSDGEITELLNGQMDSTTAENFGWRWPEVRRGFR